MAYTWIKLYLSMLDNEEIGMLPARMFKHYIQFLLAAGEYNHGGLLKPVPLLAWRLRTSEKELLESLRTMSECGLMAETPDGWLVLNFAREQAPIDGADRMRQSRKRKVSFKGDVTERHKECDAAAADPSASASASDSISDSDSKSTSDSESDSESESDSKFDSEIDSDSERDEVAVDKSTAITTYEQNIGRVTPLIDRSLLEMQNEYSPPWVVAAIEEAVRSNARSLKYVDAILQRWKRDGFRSGKKPAGQLSQEEIIRQVARGLREKHARRHEHRGAEVTRNVEEFLGRKLD